MPHGRAARDIQKIARGRSARRRARTVRESNAPEKASGAAPSAAAEASTSVLARWSLGDWLLTLVIAAVGLHLDGQPPFERDIRPQLHDPAIQYPHTPAQRQQVPSGLPVDQ